MLRNRKADLSRPIDPLRERFEYDPETGFIWHRREYKTPPHKRRADFDNLRGYRTVTIPHGHRPGGNMPLLAHRVAFALMENHWPEAVDHINGDRHDNRWSNLRGVTRSENGRHRSPTATAWPTKTTRGAPHDLLPEQAPTPSRPTRPDLPPGTYGRNTPRPSPSEIRAAFVYNPETGRVWHRRLSRTGQTREADRTTINGYRKCNITTDEGKQIMLSAHHVAFVLMENRWPYLIDHIDRDRANNKWTNLREASPAENNENRSITGKAKHISADRHRGWLFQLGHGPTRLRQWHRHFCAAVKHRTQELDRRRQDMDRPSEKRQPAHDPG